MPEPNDSTRPNLSVPQKLFAFSALGLLLGLGLCGAASVGSIVLPFSFYAAMAGVAGILISSAGLATASVWTVVQLIVTAYRKKKAR